MLLRSIRSRLIGLVVASVVPFTALIGVGLWNQWRTDQKNAVESAVAEARLIAGQVDDHIGNLKNLLSGLSVAVSFDPLDIDNNDRILRRVKAELPPYIANLMLFSLDGTNIGTSSDVGRFFAGDRSYLQQIIDGRAYAISGPIRARAGRVWVVAMARPVFDADGKLRAVLTVGTWLERFQDALNTSKLSPGSVVRIVDEKLVVIAHSANGPNWINQNLSQSPAARHFYAGRDISEVARWSDGVERITGSARTEQAPWMVSVGLPADAGFAAVMWRLGVGLSFTLVALLCALGIAWMLSRRIVRPLRQLGEDASALAAGDLSHRTRVEANGEVGVLAASFNQMAAALQQREEDAERAANDLKQAKETLSAVIDASPVAIVCSDPNRRIFLWNPAAERIFGYSAAEAIGQHSRDMPPPATSEAVGLVKRALNGELVRDLHLKRLRKDGTILDVRAAAAAMYSADGSVRGVARAYEDVSAHIRAAEQLQRIAHYDQLTGLPNRLTLQKKLGRLLSGDGAPTAIALFDLDGFKDVNDTLGHSTGDQLLIEVGQRLVEIAGDHGEVCRLGGDEFITIFPGCGNPLTVSETVEAMLKRLAEPFTIKHHVLHIAASAGIAIAPNDGKNVDELIANADLALYQAKSAGRRSYRFFLPVLRAQAQARRSLDVELRRAYSENELELYYQPQVRLADGAVIGAEALMRWRHPVAGILAPGTFIDTLAASAIAPEVSRWIVHTACSKAAGWRAQGLHLGRIAINLFPTQLADDALLHDLDEALQATGLPPEALELEITENVALDFGDAPVLQKIHDRGIKLAFDDFGTGYASLSYLRRFPLSRIKIDRSFVGKVTDDEGDAAIVRSLIAMAHNLSLEVIAEGVETTAQAAFLLNHKCEEAQGYLYAKPLPAAEFEAYLRSHLLADATELADRPVSREAKFPRRAAKPSGRRAPGR
ncbi:MAG TPA: EAL domain-containing protein [Xanthobacteraceae bacterium]|nr:EAL domain-containing protein [Xanthobacteraceae bacterium]